MDIAPLLTIIGTFGVYVWLQPEHTLSAGVAFFAMSLFNVLRLPLAMLPNMVTFAVEANLPLKRIESCLGSPEIQDRGRAQSTARPRHSCSSRPRHRRSSMLLTRACSPRTAESSA